MVAAGREVEGVGQEEVAEEERGLEEAAIVTECARRLTVHLWKIRRCSASYHSVVGENL